MFIRTLPKPAILILLVPAAIVLSVMKANPIFVFIVASLAILGLISIIGKSVNEISLYSGPVLGGLLNATFGNFTELVIAFIAVKQGLHVLVRASLTGSIIGNLLLVLGLSMFFGGLRHKTQTFSRTGANAVILMLVVAMFALIIPSFVCFGYRLDSDITPQVANYMVNRISVCVAVLLLLLYVLNLIFSLKTHKFAYMPETDTSEKPQWRKRTAIIMLIASALLVAYQSDIFVDAIEDMIHVSKIPLSEIFLGVVLVAAIGNAVDGAVAILMARKNKMDLSFQVATGASIQVALVIAPLLVLYSFFIGKPFTLVFNVFELISIWAAVMIAGYSLLDGESNWFEGAMFVIIYLIIAIVFFFHP